MECLICKKKYHACNSCGLDFDWEYTWCSTECLRISQEKIGLIPIMKKIFNALTEEERNILSDAFIDRNDNETIFVENLKHLRYYKDEGDFK